MSLIVADQTTQYSASGSDCLAENQPMDAHSACGSDCLAENQPMDAHSACGSDHLAENERTDAHSACGSDHLAENERTDAHSASGSDHLAENERTDAHSASGSDRLAENERTDAHFDEICYQQISGPYWYAKYGDFTLIVNKKTGRFNATKLCQLAGKQIYSWNRNRYSQELLRSHPDNFGHTDLYDRNIINVVKGGHGDENTTLSGSYFPKELIMSIALWLSPDYYYKVSPIVYDYYAATEKKYKNNPQEFQKELKRIEEECKRLKQKNLLFARDNKLLQKQSFLKDSKTARLKREKIDNELLKREIQQKDDVIKEKDDVIKEKDEAIQQKDDVIKEKDETIQQKDDVIKEKDDVIQQKDEELERLLKENARLRQFQEDVSLKTFNTDKCPTFTIFKKNDPFDPYEMYAIRRQKMARQDVLDMFEKKYPKMKVILEVKYNPNSINLFNRMKELIPYMKNKYNDITLLYGYTEEQFISDIRRIINTHLVQEPPVTSGWLNGFAEEERFVPETDEPWLDVDHWKLPSSSKAG